LPFAVAAEPVEDRKKLPGLKIFPVEKAARRLAPKERRS